MPLHAASVALLQVDVQLQPHYFFNHAVSPELLPRSPNRLEEHSTGKAGIAVAGQSLADHFKKVLVNLSVNVYIVEINFENLAW